MVEPQPVAEFTVILVAAAGIIVNGATALMFMRGRDRDINVRAQFLHMAADAGVSASVVVAGLLIMLTGWLWLDPLASLAIARGDRSRHVGPAARVDRSGHGRGAGCGGA